MTDMDAGQRIRKAIDGIQPETHAKDRVRQKISARSVKGARRFRWVVPVCLFAVLTAASAGILGRELSAEPGRQSNYDTSPVTEIANDAVIQIDVNDRITVGGKVYRQVLPEIAVAEERLGVVEYATDGDLVGLPVYATAGHDTVAIQTETGETRIYEYIGVSDGAGGVVDDALSDYFAERGIDSASVSMIRVRDQSRDVVTQSGDIVSYTPYYRTITDRDAIQKVLEAFAALERDMAGYEAALQTETPYDGHISLTLIFETNTAGQRTADLVCYPKIGYVFGGYRFDDAFWETLGELIEKGE